MEMQHQLLLQHGETNNGDAVLHNPFSYLVDFNHNHNHIHNSSSNCLMTAHLRHQQPANQALNSHISTLEQFPACRAVESEQASSALRSRDAHLPSLTSPGLGFGHTSLGEQENGPLDASIVHLLRAHPSSNKQGNRTGNSGRSTDRKRPYPCTLCASKFGSKMELEEHQNSHTGLKPFQCEICQSRFNRRSTLWNHKRIHSDAKPFVCPVCQMTFKWKNSLKCHKEMHSRKNETEPINTVIVHSECRMMTYATAKRRTGDISKDGVGGQHSTARKRAKQAKATPKAKALKPASTVDRVNVGLVDAEQTHQPSGVIYCHQSQSALQQEVKPGRPKQPRSTTKTEIKCEPSLLPPPASRGPSNTGLSTAAMLQQSLVDHEPQLAGLVASNGLDGAIGGGDLMLSLPPHLNNVALSYGNADLFPALDQYQLQSMNFPLLDIGLQQQLNALAATEVVGSPLSLKRSSLPPNTSSAPGVANAFNLQQPTSSLGRGSQYSSPVVAANAFESQGAFLAGDAHEGNNSPAVVHPTPTELLLNSFHPGSYQLESAALLSAVAAANHGAEQQFGAGNAQPHSLVDYLDYSQLQHSVTAPQPLQRSTPIYQDYLPDSGFTARTSNHQNNQHATIHCGASRATAPSPRTAFRPGSNRSCESMLSSLLNQGGVGDHGTFPSPSARLHDHSPTMLHNGVFSNRMADTVYGVGSTATNEVAAVLYRQP